MCELLQVDPVAPALQNAVEHKPRAHESWSHRVIELRLVQCVSQTLLKVAANLLKPAVW